MSAPLDEHNTYIGPGAFSRPAENSIMTIAGIAASVKLKREQTIESKNEAMLSIRQTVSMRSRQKASVASISVLMNYRLLELPIIRKGNPQRKSDGRGRAEVIRMYLPPEARYAGGWPTQI